MTIRTKQKKQENDDEDSYGDPMIEQGNSEDGNKVHHYVSRTLSESSDTIRCCDTDRKQWAWIVVVLSILLVAVIILARSLQKLDSTQYGLKYTNRRKQLDDAAKTGGLHAGPPGFRFVKFPSLQITEALPETTCLSRDGLRIELVVTFQYVLPETWLVGAVRKYRNYDRWSELVAAAGASAIQHSCADFVVKDFQQQREAIQYRMMEYLQDHLEGPDRDGASGLYAQAVSVSLRDLELPDAYKDAVADKEEAAQDIELAINQRSQEMTKAQTSLLAAQEEARKILDSARNDANITLTRAKLKAEETLFSFTSEAAVLVRVKENLNLTTDGVLSYLANRLYATVPHLSVKAAEPARISRKDEL